MNIDETETYDKAKIKNDAKALSHAFEKADWFIAVGLAEGCLYLYSTEQKVANDALPGHPSWDAGSQRWDGTPVAIRGIGGISPAHLGFDPSKLYGVKEKR